MTGWLLRLEDTIACIVKGKKAKEKTNTFHDPPLSTNRIAALRPVSLPLNLALCPKSHLSYYSKALD